MKISDAGVSFLSFFSRLPRTHTEPFLSSSVEVAETIKTLDMSLPSYGDVKDAKASIENVKSLEAKSAGGSGGGSSAGIIQKRKKGGGSGASLGYSTGSKKSKPEPKKSTSVGEYQF